MRGWCLFFAAIVFTSVNLSAASLSDVIDAPRPGTLLVGFERPWPQLAVGDLVFGARVHATLEPIGVVALSTDNLAALALRVASDERVAFVEPNSDQYLFDAPATNDPVLDHQYGPHLVRADAVWPISNGTTDAAVCIVDTGILASHEDLATARYLGGVDLVDNDSEPQDQVRHGTHVAGIIGATSNNGKGVAGMGQVGIYMVRVFESGPAPSDRIAEGILWCADHTIDRTVINLSLGGPTPSETQRLAVEYAYETKGKLVVAAAGNHGPCTDCVSYPAAFDDVVAVTCTDHLDRACYFSDSGPEAEIAAPGWEILSTCNNNDRAYCALSGTSMSSPMVAGAAALYWSGHAATAAQVRERLQTTVHDLGPAGRDPQFGFGRLDVLCLWEGPANCTWTPPAPLDARPPSNDDVGNATVIESLPYSGWQFALGATMETGEIKHCRSFDSSHEGTVWYKFNATRDGLVIGNWDQTAYPAKWGVFQQIGPTVLPISCHNPTDALQVKAGTTYLLQFGDDGIQLDIQTDPDLQPTPGVYEKAKWTGTLDFWVDYLPQGPPSA